MGNVIAFARDKLQNLVAALGTARDKASHSTYGMPLVDDMELSNAYRGSWLPRKVVDIPALDSCRKWRAWQAEADQIEMIEEEEKRLNLRGKVLEARVKARLWGGAAILIGTGEADLTQPLNVERINAGGVKYLTVFTRRDLTAGEIEHDPASEWYGRPKLYTLKSKTGLAVDIHPSRLVVFLGSQHADDDLLPGSINQGWGDSALIPVFEAIRNADSTAANIASLTFEAKVDVIRVPEMMASLADAGYRERLLERFSLAATAKGINQTLLLDKEEEYEQKSASFQTLPDVMMSFLQMVAGAADIPLTRLLGMSPGGMNSTGESDLRNYYDRISAMQEIEMTPAMYRLDEALIRSALGSRPPEVHYIWASLWQISDKERAEIGKIDAETIEKLNNTGLFPPEALANAGANMLIEHSIMPGLQEAIDEAGGLPDYEMEAEVEAKAERLRIEASAAGKPTTDAAPRTLYIRRDVLNAAEIIAWAKGEGFETTLKASDLHVTVIHTRTLLDWIKVGQAGEWSGEDDGKMTIAPGGPRLMERFGDAVVLQFASSRLTWRHEDIKRMGAETDFPEYQPHVTISWDAPDLDLSEVKPYQGKIVLGPEVFEEVNENWRNTIKEA